MTTPMRDGDRAEIELTVDGATVSVPDDGASLLEVLRDRLGIRSAKDGCSPQGQCGCCTVLVDGQPRVSCVTPVKRVRGRAITTVDGLDDDIRTTWADAFTATGASQCGFCTPGIVCRFEGLRSKAEPGDRVAASKALQAHLCRCTGWQPIVDAWCAFGETPPTRDMQAAARRAEIEGGNTQHVSTNVALGRGGFADDTAPGDALVAVLASDGSGWAVGETLTEARARAGKVQGRRTTDSFDLPIEVPPGAWLRTLRTGWVEPAYLETDASWCEPGGEPVTPLANGGAFGGKRASEVAAAARRLADEHGRAVRALYSREDAVRFGPKRPPLAAGIVADGSGIVRVARTPGIAEAIARVAPALSVEEIDIAGPPTSADIRAAGWAEVVALQAAVAGEVGWVEGADGGAATASVADDGSISVRVRAGEVLDEIVLQSYCTGAAHMALSWVTSESLAVAPDGEVHDLTIRSFGILRAVDMPAVEVVIEPDHREPVNGSDAVFAAVAAAVWLRQGCPPDWPSNRSVVP